MLKLILVIKNKKYSYINKTEARASLSPERYFKNYVLILNKILIRARVMCIINSQKGASV